MRGNFQQSSRHALFFVIVKQNAVYRKTFFVSSRLIGISSIGLVIADLLEQLSLQSHHHPQIGAQLSYHSFH